MEELSSQLKSQNKSCTGCGVCVNVCPVNAIEKAYDARGFWYPHIIKSKCISCHKCERVCPKLHSFKMNRTEPDCYAMRAADSIRRVSSSGGAFTVFANVILDRGGIVCGATMSKEDYRVFHICIKDKGELERLRGSKYVQSDTEFVYREMKEYLCQGKEVLFVGCPCQIAGARNYFGEREERLYLIDLLCHGVPSNQMWQDYINENFEKDKLSDIQFRNKLNGWRSDQLRAFFKDGSSEVIPWAESAYEEGFQKSICLRDGCENCEFSGKQRQGDITIGDFWKIRDYVPECDDKKGTSVVLVNNERGQELLDAACLGEDIYDIRQLPLGYAMHNRLKETIKTHPMKKRFYTLYPKRGFSESVMQCRHALYDIGLVGIYCALNYGGELTQYALYCALLDMGYSVLMIERPADSRKATKASLARKPILFRKDPYPSYAKSRIFANLAEMKFLNLQCKVFVAGSDQMFNNNLYNDCNKYMAMNFVSDNHIKIAYAASWGHDRIWGAESDRAEESYFLRKFDAFSVREDSAVELCEQEFGVSATQVLDPVFLCPYENYKRLMKHASEEVPQERYLFSYILDVDKEKEDILNLYARKKQLVVQAMIDELKKKKFTPIEDFWSIPTRMDAKIEDWIALIANSEFVITDSFHGMCMAIIFHKQFIAIVNKSRGETRFTSIAKTLGLESRLVYSYREMERILDEMETIDYDAVEERLTKERNKSRKWLKNAIENNKGRKKPLSEFDILDGRCDDITLHIDRRYDDLKAKYDELSRNYEEIKQMLESRACLKAKK